MAEKGERNYLAGVKMNFHSRKRREGKEKMSIQHHKGRGVANKNIITRKKKKKKTRLRDGLKGGRENLQSGSFSLSQSGMKKKEEYTDVRDTEAEEMETVTGLDTRKVNTDASAVLSHFY